MTSAENFAKQTKGKYPNIEHHETSIAETKLVKFAVNFIDGSTHICIMTRQQRDGLFKSKWKHWIKNTGGLGYVKEQPKMSLPCLICGKETGVYPSDLDECAQVCSEDCSEKYIESLKKS